jgi:hypothetical protein
VEGAIVETCGGRRVVAVDPVSELCAPIINITLTVTYFSSRKQLRVVELLQWFVE